MTNVGTRSPSYHPTSENIQKGSKTTIINSIISVLHQNVCQKVFTEEPCYRARVNDPPTGEVLRGRRGHRGSAGGRPQPSAFSSGTQRIDEDEWHVSDPQGAFPVPKG